MTLHRTTGGVTVPRLLALAALAVLVLALPMTGESANGRAAAAAVGSDFNGDGFADLAIGLPYEDIGSVTDGGAVNVVYGSANGLKTAGNSFWHQDSTGVAGSPRTNDHFGSALAHGDFDGDGFADLAIGIPDKGLGLIADEGGVQILRGGAGGLVAWQYWNILNATADGTSGALCDCRFGAALAAGDFNGDGRDDLAIGMPNKDLRRVWAGAPEVTVDAGAVLVLYGTDAGLSAFRFGDPSFELIAPANDDAPVYQRDELDLLGDHFGVALAAGNHDDILFEGRADDLVIGGYRSVIAILGKPYRQGYTFGGIDAEACGPGVDYSTRCTYELLFPSEERDSQVIRALAMSDGDTPGHAIWVGAPFADPSGVANAGAVIGLYPDGSTSTYTQGSSSLVRGVKEPADRFGWALAVGDFGFVAIGVPNEDTDDGFDTGIVQLLDGTSWSQASSGVPGVAEAGDRFGAALATCNFGNGPAADLAIGVPLEDFTAGGLTRSNAGVVDVLYGSTSGGLATTGIQDWSQATTGLGGGFESNDQFGYVLACG